MFLSTMARPKKFTEGAIQLGWRLDGKDEPLLKGLQAYADAHRLSRNSALTIAVERLLAQWEKEKSEAKKLKS
jgi:hypothetical protein